MPIWCPSRSIRRTTSRLASTWAPMRKKVAFTPRWARPSSSSVVVDRLGPSSKVRAISFCSGSSSPSSPASRASAVTLGLVCPYHASAIAPIRAKSSSRVHPDCCCRLHWYLILPSAAFPEVFAPTVCAPDGLFILPSDLDPPPEAPYTGNMAAKTHSPPPARPPGRGTRAGHSAPPPGRG